LHLPALASESLWRRAVTRVAGVVAGRVVLFVAEMMSQFTIESTLDERFGELLEQAVLTKQVFGLLVVFAVVRRAVRVESVA
jgi:hypothetical protein